MTPKIILFRMKYAVYFLLVLFSFCHTKGQSQAVTPFTFNNGGGSSATMEWSMNESVSIANFINAGYSLNTGVLQPLTTIVTGVDELGSSVSNILHIKSRLNQMGSLSIQLLDAKLMVLQTLESGAIYYNYEKDIAMQMYPDGYFYVRVYFIPMSGVAKTGIYKIIKLSK
jgi:hypothetical protein